MANDVLLARSLQRTAGGLHLGDKFLAVLRVRFFKEMAQGPNLSLGAVEAIDDVLLEIFVYLHI